MKQDRSAQYRNSTLSGMSTLTQCLNKVTADGYTESYAVTGQGLHAPATDRHFQPEEVHIVDFYRFEGPSNPDDMAILYVIEAGDSKGTLVDAYGTYADGTIADFIRRVEDIHKEAGR